VGADGKSALSARHEETVRQNNPVYRDEDYFTPEIAYVSHQWGQDIMSFDHEQWENSKREAKKTYQLTEEEHNAVDDYVGGSAYNLNATMRGDTSYEKTAFIDYWIQQTINGLSKFPQFAGRTYRNLTFKTQSDLEAFLSQHSAGENVETVQFASASKKPNGYTVPGNYIVHMVINGVTGRDISESYSIPNQQEVIYLPGTMFKITDVKTANDGFPLIYAEEVKENGKDMETNSGRDRQSAPGANLERQRGNAKRKGNDLDGIFNIEGVRGGGEAENGVQIQQPGRFSQEVTSTPQESVGAAPSGFDPVSHLQYEYGTIPEGEKAVRDDSLPKSTDGKDKVSHTARTAKGAKVTTDELAELIDKDVVKGGLSYIPITNSATVQNAARTIQRLGWDDALKEWKAAVHSGKTGADLVAQGALLLNNAAAAGNKGLWLDILHDYQLLGTNTAQGMQALRILKTLSPDDKLYMIERSVKQMVDDMRLDTEIELDEDLLHEFEEAETDEERDDVLRKIQQSVADQIPSTFMDKFTALRYVNMLGNLRTTIRNGAGNIGMKAVASAKNAVATGIEAVANKLSGGKIKKTKSLTVSKAQMEAAKADFEQFKSIVLGGGKYADARQASTEFAQGVQDRRTIFKGNNIVSKAMEGYRKATDWMMNNSYFGDAAFSKSAYARALAGYLKANGITDTDYSKVATSIMDNARLYAVQEAQEQTFRDSNWLSDWVSKIGRRRDTPAVAKSVFEGIMPFRRTPANVLVRAEEYSPLGIFNSVYYSIKAMQKGSDITGAQAINSWAKTLTGSGIFALGMLLSNLGILTAGPDKDESKENFEKLSGYQNYALQIGEYSITIDWLTPAAMPLLMGAELWEQIQDGGFEGKDLEQALLSVADPMIQMSMLQGVNDTLGNIKYADNNVGQLVANAALSYLTQGLTNTALGQIERAFEDSRMTTYVDKDSGVPDWLQRAVGKASAKIPGWDYNQVPYINAWGEEEENPNWAVGLVYNMLSPGYIEKGASDEVYHELIRLNEAQSDKNVFPSSPGKTISIDGEKRNLSSDEWVALAKAQGQTARKLVEGITQSSAYSGLDDAQKAKAISCAYEYAREKARVETLDDYKAYDEKWMEKVNDDPEAIMRHALLGDADKYADLPIDRAVYISELMKALQDEPREVNADGKEYTSVRPIQKIEAVAGSTLTEKQQTAVMEDILEEKTYQKYLEVLREGFDNDQFAESYRINLDTDGNKNKVIREMVEEMGIGWAAAKTLYEIYHQTK